MSITKNNYEEWMVAFLDGELNNVEQNLFTDFIKKNPHLKKELAAYESVQISVDEEIVFENKESLYKKASAVALLKKAWPLAAAVVLAFAIWPFITKNNSVQKKVVAENKVETTIDTFTATSATPVEQEIIAKQPIASAPKKGGIQNAVEPVVNNTVEKIPTPQPKKIIAKKGKTTPINMAAPKNKIENINYELDKPVLVQEINKPSQVIDPIQEEKKEIVVQDIKTPPTMSPPAKKNNQPEEKNNALVIIDEIHHPQLYKKINNVATRVENKIEIIEEFKKQPITVCIGKRKLFTINK